TSCTRSLRVSLNSRRSRSTRSSASSAARRSCATPAGPRKIPRAAPQAAAAGAPRCRPPAATNPRADSSPNRSPALNHVLYSDDFFIRPPPPFRAEELEEVGVSTAAMPASTGSPPPHPTSPPPRAERSVAMRGFATFSPVAPVRLRPAGILEGPAAMAALEQGRAWPLAGGPLAFADVEAIARAEGGGAVSVHGSVGDLLRWSAQQSGDGRRFLDPARAIEHGRALLAAGADIVDVGGESTRPRAEPIAAEEEIRRIE